MTGLSAGWLWAASLWLGLGLVLQAWICARQWQHLAGLSRASDTAAQPESIGYGQRRALFQWLVYLEQCLRVAFWLGAGALAASFQPFSTSGLAGALLFVVVFALIDQLLRLLLPWARWRWVDRAYGMSRMSGRELGADFLRRIGLQLVIAAMAAVWIVWPLALLDAPGGWWWSTVALLTGAAALFWGRPHLIEPLFNRFTALPNGELRDRLQAMMQRCGAQLEQVWVVDSSRRSKLANAYFAGLGRRKRVVLFDTLIAQLSPAELEAVMAHELGHYRCGHLRRYYLLQGTLLAGSFLLFGLLQPMIAPGLSSIVWAVAAYVLLPALAWPLQPWFAGLRRRYEYEADAYAARHAERDALVSALERLLKNNLGAPTMATAYMLFFATHPPADKRLLQLKL
ncbi:M48 family metalloprotease [Salinisphaera aquimarina]|uniref:M48 family metalloprotease n=1 Tax=Salinisphaera aquimarina TaxID=2094031 RepID=A0ABV7EN93_9GAMM